MKAYLTCILSIIVFVQSTAQAQYKFDSKELKKTYSKLEEAYAEYDYEKILSYEDRVLELVEPKQDTLTALVYFFLGESYNLHVNDPETSLEFYQKEMALRQKIQDPSEIDNTTYFNMAKIMAELGQYEEAEVLYLRLLKSDREEFGVKSDEYIGTALGLGVHYQYVRSYESFKKGLKLYRGLFKHIKKDHPQYGELLNGIAGIYSDLGSYKQAEKYFLESIDSFTDAGMYISENSILSLNSLAQVYERTGRYPEAESNYLEAISILDGLGGEYLDFYQLIYNNIGRTYYLLGNYGSADKYLADAVKIAAEYYGEDSDIHAIALSVQADSYIYQSRLKEAESTYARALEIFQSSQGEESSDVAGMTYSLSKVYKEQKQYDKALEYNKRAVQGFETSIGKEDDDYTKSISNMGDIYYTQNEFDIALGYYENALKSRKRNIGIKHPKYAETTNKLALLSWAMDDRKSAESYYKETFDNYFAQIDAYFPTMSEEEKAKFYNSKVRVTFEQFNSYAFDQNKEDKGLLGEMYNYQLATKGLIMYATGKVRKSILNSGDSILIQKFNTWISQKEQLSKLFSSTQESLDTRNAKIDSLTSAANRLEKELSLASSEFATTYVRNRVKWQDIQEKLKPGEAAVEIIRFRNFSPDSAGFFTNEIYYAALILTDKTKENPELVLLRNGKLMEHKYLANYRNAIRYKVDENHSYRLFWKPIANKLKDINKVYFSPDGIYNQISIYTLRNPKTNKFTLDEIEIQLVNNTKDLVALHSDNSANFRDKKAHLFGFPNYNMGLLDQESEADQSAQEAVNAASQGRGTDRSVARGATRGTRGDRGTRGTRGIRGGLSRGLRGSLQRYINSNDLLAMLPGTKREIETITAQYEKFNLEPETMIGNAALEDSIKNVSKPQTLHIATHGFFLENEEPEPGEFKDKYVENPLLRSGLIMAGANSFLSSGAISEKFGDGQDGILTAYEAMNLDLENTDLVVLSACETGLGEVSNGEGVYGLQRAFQIAGAKSVIMSMWTVDDDATQELMTNFYEEWLRTGDKHGSFIRAQKKLKAKWKSPYYWGAFVMVGY